MPALVANKGRVQSGPACFDFCQLFGMTDLTALQVHKGSLYEKNIHAHDCGYDPLQFRLLLQVKWDSAIVQGQATVVLMRS